MRMCWCAGPVAIREVCLCSTECVMVCGPVAILDKPPCVQLNRCAVYFAIRVASMCSVALVCWRFFRWVWVFFVWVSFAIRVASLCSAVGVFVCLAVFHTRKHKLTITYNNKPPPFYASASWNQLCTDSCGTASHAMWHAAAASWARTMACCDSWLSSCRESFRQLIMIALCLHWNITSVMDRQVWVNVDSLIIHTPIFEFSKDRIEIVTNTYTR